MLFYKMYFDVLVLFLICRIGSRMILVERSFFLPYVILPMPPCPPPSNLCNLITMPIQGFFVCIMLLEIESS